MTQIVNFASLAMSSAMFLPSAFLCLIVCTLAADEPTARRAKLKIQHLSGVEKCKQPLHFNDDGTIKYRRIVTKNGKVISEDKEDKEMTFVVGSYKQPLGLSKGTIFMCEGARRKIEIPPELAYGVNGSLAQGVPPDASLIYTFQLLSIKHREDEHPELDMKNVEGQEPELYFDHMDQDGNDKVSLEEVLRFTRIHESDEDETEESHNAIIEKNRKMFYRYDRDKNGYVDINEFRIAMKEDMHDEL